MVYRRVSRGLLGILVSIPLIVCCPHISAAKNCSCLKFGSSLVCVPNPACSTEFNTVKDVGFSVEKAAKETSVLIQNATKDAQNQAGKKLAILDTGYSQLAGFGMEEPGYGLYSYAILTEQSARSSAFLGEVFKSVHEIDDSARRSQLNIFYLPIKKEATADFVSSVSQLAARPSELGEKYSTSFYDYKLARAILNHICNPPAPAVMATCQGALSPGPYVFTYAKPASSLEPVPPPFLLADFSIVNSAAFGEYMLAFKEQVKRGNFSDGELINSLRLRILNVALTGAGLIPPIQKAIEGLLHMSK